jgi:hypothetical protein
MKKKKKRERENQRNQQVEVVDKQTKKFPGSGTIEFQS